MTAHLHLEQLISTFAGWLTHRRELNELHQIDRTELDRIAGDLQVSPSALEELVEKGPHAADELKELLKALGVDEAALARTQPTVLRDMERVCALCQHKRECDQDIAAGTATERYKDYCPNASTIGQLDETAAGQ
jgi:transcriptional regulator with XRE-family HTH domain